MKRTRLLPQTLFRLCCAALSGVMILALPLASRAAPADAEGDAVRGKAAFERRCTGCHSLDQIKEGPALRNVYGRKAGTYPGFDYSDALKAANVTWSDATLDKWLTNTDSLVPGNNMDFHVQRADERADIIRFLRVSSGK